MQISDYQQFPLVPDKLYRSCYGAFGQIVFLYHIITVTFQAIMIISRKSEFYNHLYPAIVLYNYTKITTEICNTYKMVRTVQKLSYLLKYIQQIIRNGVRV